jgi:predicted DNA-binding helix-hairpin-helix protein
MIVGATETPDAAILEKSSSLYKSFGLRRIYYSAFSPIPHSDSRLPVKPAPLLREHRLYQADWLMRFYGFHANELTTSDQPNLSLDKDPKLAWALRNRGFFPVDINTAPKEALLRVPGLGVRNVKKILKMRRFHRFRLEDLARLKAAV